MNYQEVKAQLEAAKLDLVKKMENPDLSPGERIMIQNSIDNVEYMIELTCMNHFERGQIIH